MTPEELRVDCERAMPMREIPQKAVDLIWLLAWENGHIGGVSDVTMWYDDLRAVALLAAGKRAE